MNTKNNKTGKPKKKFATILSYILIPLMLISGIAFFMSSGTEEKLEYYEVVSLFDEGKIEEYSLNLSSGALSYKEKGSDEKKSFAVPSVSLFLDDIHEGVIKHNRENPKDKIKASYVQGSTGQWIYNILPTLILLVIMGALTFFMFRRMNQTMSNENNRTLSFGKARIKHAKDEKRKATFKDVAGADEEKEELEEIVEFLKNPSKFDSLGARIPKGVLLVGPPGTGKTLLARAVAGEADVPFFSISGSDFVEMYVGVGASRVRDLFDQAKRNSPSIIFIDEIDAVGRHRGAGLGGGHDEREQTLNQLLVEMDGFGVNDGVIVIAATNRPDILDPALLRPGRFDRQITVNHPDIKGREEILKVHAKGKPLGSDVDLSTIAKSTAGFSGADLANLLNEAALLAARKKKSVINTEDVEEATIKVIVGPQKKSLVITDDEKRKTAFHEAGHAIVTRMLGTQDPVHSISIIPSGRALGYTLSLPEKDKFSVYKNELLDDICVLMGGRAAEQLMCDDISGGASNDMERATDIARKMVTKLGMSNVLGPVVYSAGNSEVFLGKDFGTTKNYSEKVAIQIDEEIFKFVMSGYERALDILKENKDIMIFIADYLVKHEIMDAEQFELCFTEGVTEEMLDTVTERKKKASDTENEARKKELSKNKNKKANEETPVVEDIDPDIFSDDIINK